MVHFMPLVAIIIVQILVLLSFSCKTFTGGRKDLALCDHRCRSVILSDTVITKAQGLICVK